MLLKPLFLAAIASLVAHARACSYMPPSGFAITDARMHGNNSLRLKISNMGDEEDWEPIQSVQALLELDTGDLTLFDNQNLEFTPAVLPFEESQTTRSSFLMANTVVLARWYSTSLGREFVLYSVDVFSDMQLAICNVPDGTCEMSLPVPSGIGLLEAGEAPLVWDDIGVVSLRLQCCVCDTNVYVKYNKTGIFDLYSWDEGYSIGQTVWSPGKDAVFVTSSFATGLEEARPLKITRYNYATLTTTTVSLSPSELEAFMGSCGAGCIAGIAGIVCGAVAVLLLCLLAGCLMVKRRRPKAPPAVELKRKEGVIESQQVEAKVMANAA